MGLGTGLGRVVGVDAARPEWRGTDEAADDYLRRLAAGELSGADLPRADVLLALREVISLADAPRALPRPRRARVLAAG